MRMQNSVRPLGNSLEIPYKVSTTHTTAPKSHTPWCLHKGTECIHHRKAWILAAARCSVVHRQKNWDALQQVDEERNPDNGASVSTKSKLTIKLYKKRHGRNKQNH